MFPRHYELYKEKIPSFYFDGEEPPTYHQIPIPENASLQEIIQIIYDSAYTKHMCGYITKSAIFYFIDERGKIQIDGSKEFIFLAEHGVEAFTHPTPDAILSFLQDPCDKGIFISEVAAYYIEKTPEAYRLCVELDEIWDENYFYENVIEKSDDDDLEEKSSLLTALLKVYEKKKYGEATSVWDSVQHNKDEILEGKLFLHVEKFAVEEPDE